MGLKKQIQDVIFRGDPQSVIWRSDATVLSPKSKIYSRKDCDVIFLRKGVYLGSFDDREEFYVVSNKRNQIFTALFKKEKEITDCNIYYINRVAQLENKWGTPNKIDVYDKSYDMQTHVGANGAYKFSINNSIKLFSKVQGANEFLTQDMVKEFFKSELNVEIRNAIATVFLKNKYGLDDIATITTKEKQIAEQIKDIISPIFADYGVAIEKFFIERFMYDEDFLQMLNKIKKDSILKNLEFDLDKGLRKDQRKESVKTAKVPSEDFAFCNECGHKNPGTAKFCSNCGSKM
mgnify:CR=1 FL=1